MEDQLVQSLQQQLEELRGQFLNLHAEHSAVLQTLQSQQQQPPLLQQKQSIGSPKPIRPPTFKGDVTKGGKVEDWLYQLNSYLGLTNVTDDKFKIQFAASLLEEHAARWYRLQTQNGFSFPNWEDFQKALLEFFKPVNALKVARDRLAALVQKDSVRNYVQRFTELCLEIPDLGETEQLDRFVRGLRVEVRREVDLHDPKTFNEAAKIAERWDCIAGPRPNFGFKKNYHPPIFFKNSGSSLSKNAPQPMEIDAIPTQPRRVKRGIKQNNSVPCYLCKQIGHRISDCPEMDKIRKLGNSMSPVAGK